MIVPILQVAAGMTIWDGLALLISGVVGIAAATSSYYQRQQYKKQYPDDIHTKLSLINKQQSDFWNELNKLATDQQRTQAQLETHKAVIDVTVAHINTSLVRIEDKLDRMLESKKD